MCLVLGAVREEKPLQRPERCRVGGAEQKGGRDDGETRQKQDALHQLHRTKRTRKEKTRDN